MALEKSKKSASAGASSSVLGQFVVFAVAEEEYCVEILKVQEIIRMVPITWLPRKPVYVIGVLNLRGEIIPVIDLRLKFGLARKEYTKFTRILIAQIGEKLIGMVVDGVEEVLELREEQMESEPDMIASGQTSDYIRGIAKIEDRVIIMLDLNKVLTEQDVIALGQVSSGSASVPRT